MRVVQPSRSTRGTAVRVVAVASGAGQQPDQEKFWNAFTAVPWDKPARPWEKFWNTKVAGTVVEADLDEGTVTGVPVRYINLSPPESKEEWLDRLETNLVYFRQNYIVTAVGVWLVTAALRNLPVACGIVAGAAALLCCSNALLGETQLWWDERFGPGSFTWNETRVMGVGRSMATAALAAAAALCFALDPVATLTLSVRSALGALVAVMAHASCRPVDLTSLGSTVLEDLKGVKSREELKKTVTGAFGKLKKVVSQKKGPEPFTIFNVKGTGAPTSGSYDDDDGPSPPGQPPRPPDRRQLPPGQK